MVGFVGNADVPVKNKAVVPTESTSAMKFSNWEEYGKSQTQFSKLAKKMIGRDLLVGLYRDGSLTCIDGW